MKPLNYKELLDLPIEEFERAQRFVLSHGEGEEYWEEWFEFPEHMQVSKLDLIKAEALSQAKYLSIIYDRDLTVNDLYFVLYPGKV